ncbi:hypothetical protein [Gluconobacter wancherniae]|uniref:hypothetical protein n=1 Tax=Gluconobacter wancherniae TaxID=1307955 RepID=UPI001B8BDDCA|nr:hypothetical protein [Gluconobacter wancherniae]MBS1088359.1 hypothetical protein [Gluconobacter wancherniae]
MSESFSTLLKKTATQGGHVFNSSSCSSDVLPSERIEHRWTLLKLRLQGTSTMAQINNNPNNRPIDENSTYPEMLSSFNLSDDLKSKFSLLYQSYTSIMSEDFIPSDEDAFNFIAIASDFMKALPALITKKTIH